MRCNLHVQTCFGVHLGGDNNIEKLSDEFLSLCDQLKKGDLDENIRHLKYKFETLTKSAMQQLTEKTKTIDMLLDDLKQTQHTFSPQALSPEERSVVVKSEPVSPVEFQHLKVPAQHTSEPILFPLSLFFFTFACSLSLSLSLSLSVFSWWCAASREARKFGFNSVVSGHWYNIIVLVYYQNQAFVCHHVYMYM